MRTITAMLLLLAHFSAASFSKDEVKLTLSVVEENFLVITLINMSSHELSLKQNYCLSSLGDLSLEIKDENLTFYPLNILVNDRCNPNRVIKMEPYGVQGKVLHMDGIKTMYSLREEKYHIKAKVCHREGYCKESNQITFSYAESDVNNGNK